MAAVKAFIMQFWKHILLFGLVLFLGIFGSAYLKARAYNRATGANVSMWDALFIELKVQQPAK